MMFNIGDYIGDKNDTCWKVESVTEQEYAVTYIPENIHKTISREEKPYRHSHDKDYAEDYHLLRAHDHSDIAEYPIGSIWKCSKENGLNNPKTDTVIIADYAHSSGTFWVYNTKRPGLVFIACKENLQPVLDKSKEEEENIYNLE